MRPAWKQLTLGVAIGIAAWLIWFGLDTFVLFPFFLFALSLGLVTHAPFILDTGEYDPAHVRDAGLSWTPVGRGRRLLEMIATVLISVVLLLAGGWLWERLKLRIPSLAAAVSRDDVVPILLSVLWSIGVIASWRKLRAASSSMLATRPTLKVPDIITLQLRSVEPMDLSGVIVALTVSTGQRNPRCVYFPKTDEAGRSTLDRQDFVGQFADATEEDLMGSWGAIDDAFAEVGVSLYDPAPALADPEGSMAWPLSPHEQTKWPSRAAEYAYRSTCRNLLFAATEIVVDLAATSHVELWVTPAQGRASGLGADS